MWNLPAIGINLIMVSIQDDFINSCTESREILELGSQGATPRQVILSTYIYYVDAYIQTIWINYIFLSFKKQMN